MQDLYAVLESYEYDLLIDPLYESENVRNKLISARNDRSGPDCNSPAIDLYLGDKFLCLKSIPAIEIYRQFFVVRLYIWLRHSFHHSAPSVLDQKGYNWKFIAYCIVLYGFYDFYDFFLPPDPTHSSSIILCNIQNLSHDIWHDLSDDITWDLSFNNFIGFWNFFEIYSRVSTGQLT